MLRSSCGGSRHDEEQRALHAAAASVGFWRRVGTSRTFWVSEYGRRLLGLPLRGGVTQDAILAATHPADAQRIRSVFAADVEQPEGRLVEFRVVHPGGEQCWILSRSCRRRGKGADSFDVSGILVDITACKAEEEAEMESLRRDLAHLMRVSQASELSSGLAHELTQPLTAILANAQAARLMLASKPCDRSAVMEVVDDIVQEAQRAGEVIKRLRALLKKSDGVSEVIDVNALCESTIALLHAEAVTRGITLASTLGPTLPMIEGDSVQLQQVLLNLLMNAIEAIQSMPAARRVVVVRTRSLGQAGIEISVEDRGPGIDVTDRARLFEPFFTTKERGLGVGLSICAAIIHRHGGALELKANAFGGTTAYVRLATQSKKGAPS